MSDTNPENRKQNLQPSGKTGISRKNFLKFAGVSAATAITFGLTGCGDDNPVDPGMETEMVNLGSGDVGILNYAYALEQLEAAFYITVLDSAYSGMSSEEGQILEDLRDHEVAHRDWFEAALSSVASESIIPGLTPDFSSVDFTDRNSVLTTAQTFEDLGVSAYNGAGQLIQNTDYLVEAGKIVSVEARHAAAIRSILASSNTSFAGDDIINSDGLELTRTPNEVLPLAQNFIVEQIDGSNLPQPQ